MNIEYPFQFNIAIVFLTDVDTAVFSHHPIVHWIAIEAHELSFRWLCFYQNIDNLASILAHNLTKPPLVTTALTAVFLGLTTASKEIVGFTTNRKTEM